MINHTILTFAAAREIVGAASFKTDLAPGATVSDLRARILEAYPAFRELSDFAIARNEAYALADEVLVEGDELVIIPPVSGG
jgi:molybdopterin converting factor small subunit